MTTESATSSASTKLYYPIEQTWTITEKKLRKLAANTKADYDNELKSEKKEVSAVPEIEYYLNILPFAKNGEISLYLSLKNAKKYQIRGKFSFTIKSANHFTLYDTVYDDDTDNWGDDICSVDNFLSSSRKFVADGKCVIEMRGILIFNDIPMSKMIQMQASPLVQQLWKSDDKDFKIVVGKNGYVMIHKCVLSVRSDTFRQEAKTKFLKIIDFHLITVQLAVEFFYDRNIFETMELDDAFELLRFADKYVIDDLQGKLITYIFYRISPANVCDLVNRAIDSNSLKLRQFCFNFMMICSRHGIPVDHLDILDKEFAAELFQKTLSSPFD